MTNGFRKEVAGEKIVLRSTMGTGLGFYPEKIFDGCRFAAFIADGGIKFPDFFFNIRSDRLGGFGEGIEI